MAEVLLHVYDMKSTNVRANAAILQLNKLMRDRIGAGGIFHGAVQIYDKEWSFGFCMRGSGVVSGPPKENPMYTYRETVPLGRTALSRVVVDEILTDMSIQWLGCTYDLLYKNCNHFCEEFSARLGVQKPPLWANRFARTGGATVEVIINTMETLKQAYGQVMSAGRVCCPFLLRPFMCWLNREPIWLHANSSMFENFAKESPGNEIVENTNVETQRGYKIISNLPSGS